MKAPMQRVSIASVLAALACLLGALPAAAASDYREAKPLPIREVEAIYNGKTWVWPDGAGYFDGTGQFIAWSGRGRNLYVAKGSWRTDNEGRICFDAEWKGRKGTGQKSTCFMHRKSTAGAIYQRAKGTWYVFKHARTRKSDEIRKLRPGNSVSAKLKKLGVP